MGGSEQAILSTSLHNVYKIAFELWLSGLELVRYSELCWKRTSGDGKVCSTTPTHLNKPSDQPLCKDEASSPEPFCEDKLNSILTPSRSIIFALYHLRNNFITQCTFLNIWFYYSSCPFLPTIKIFEVVVSCGTLYLKIQPFVANRVLLGTFRSLHSNKMECNEPRDPTHVF